MDIKRKYKTTNRILNRIINKGGLYGRFAELYLTDSEIAKQFIIECSEQCDKKSLIEFWGERLTQDIIKYKTLVSE